MDGNYHLELSTFEDYQNIDLHDFWWHLMDVSLVLNEEDSSFNLGGRSSFDNIADEHDPLLYLPQDEANYEDYNLTNTIEHDPLLSSFPSHDLPSYYDHPSLDFPLPDQCPHLEQQSYPDLLNDFESWWASNNLSLSPYTNEAPMEFADTLVHINGTFNDSGTTGVTLLDQAVQDNSIFNEAGSSSVSLMDHESIVFSSDENLMKNKKKMNRRSKPKPSSGLELEEIQKYFHLPIVKAAKELRVGVTVLKKRCRELSIARWPHRKIKSLNCLIDNVKVLGMTDETEIEMLEEHKKTMAKVPGLSLTLRTKKLRQACFKANYKRRRLLQSPL